MKTTALLSLIVSIFALQAHAMGKSRPADPQSGDTWLTPVLGAHTLHGDPGCDSLSISVQTLDPTLGTKEYVISTNEDSIGFSFILNYATALSVTPTTLSYQYDTSDGQFGCGEHHRDNLEIDKSSDGTLKSVHYLKQAAPASCIASWNTYSSLNCE